MVEHSSLSPQDIRGQSSRPDSRTGSRTVPAARPKYPKPSGLCLSRNSSLATQGSSALVGGTTLATTPILGMAPLRLHPHRHHFSRRSQADTPLCTPFSSSSRMGSPLQIFHLDQTSPCVGICSTLHQQCASPRSSLGCSVNAGVEDNPAANLQACSE